MVENPILYCGLCPDKFCVKGKAEGRIVVEGTALTPNETTIENCEIRKDQEELAKQEAKLKLLEELANGRITQAEWEETQRWFKLDGKVDKLHLGS